MQHPIYTIGYTGIKPERLLSIVDTLGAVLIDIRYRAQSRVPQWNKSALVKLFTDAYAHIPALGNELYKSGGMKIVNYQVGRELIKKINMPVILMCGCQHPTDCHRTVVANMLRAEGFIVTELTGETIAALLDEPTKLPRRHRGGKRIKYDQLTLFE